VCAYNQITGLADDAPLLRLTNLYSVDLSNNRCTSFGQLRFMESVSALNFDGALLHGRTLRVCERSASLP